VLAFFKLTVFHSIFILPFYSFHPRSYLSLSITGPHFHMQYKNKYKFLSPDMEKISVKHRKTDTQKAPGRWHISAKYCDFLTSTI